MSELTHVLVLNGPNLGMLGVREPEVYGYESLADLEARLVAANEDLTIEWVQSDDESVLIAALHRAAIAKTPVILNPAAFTHYSYGLRDAVAIVTTSGIPLIEVHLSNPHSREEFRHTSVISGVATGVIAGFGFDSYTLALSQLRALSAHTR